MVSCTVSDLKMLATWNARPMPWRTISGGERPGEIDAVEQHLSLGRRSHRHADRANREARDDRGRAR
jgi:hypothetical protein